MGEIYCEWEQRMCPAEEFKPHPMHGMVHETDTPHTVNGLPITPGGWSGPAEMTSPPAPPGITGPPPSPGGGSGGGGNWSAPAAPPPDFE